MGEWQKDFKVPRFYFEVLAPLSTISKSNCMRVEKFPGLKGEKLAACFRFSHQKPVYNIIRGGWGPWLCHKNKSQPAKWPTFRSALSFQLWKFALRQVKYWFWLLPRPENWFPRPAFSLNYLIAPPAKGQWCRRTRDEGRGSRDTLKQIKQFLSALN